MNNSSVPPSYSTISVNDEPITITGLSDTIKLTSYDTSTSGIAGYNSNIGYSGFSGGTVTLSTGALGGSYSTISSLTTGQLTAINVGSGLNGTDYTTFAFNTPEDWVDQFPDWNRVQKMCEEYPGLKIVFEKFKTTYKLVKDHYDTPADQRPRP